MTVLFTSSAITLDIFITIIPFPIYYGDGTETTIKFSTDPEVGIFGFMTCDYTLYVLIACGLFGGALTFGSYGYIVKFFSPLVLCTALLFEPFFS
jgi:hypothetical protein